MPEIADFNRHRYMSLATFRRSGAEVQTPVWFAAADGKLYVFTAGASGKVKRLHRSSRVRIAVSDARGRVRGAWRDAAARIISETRAIERARVALRAKYGWQMWLTDLFSRLTGRIQRRAWIEIELHETLREARP
ncbi:MAG TPA: PPOX class F420-dependent oxidoreductase [Methylomirabilota bacterium]|nr:PPOX class F420-dependent oxidoreductase [Methylomirabilota bacterium]